MQDQPLKKKFINYVFAVVFKPRSNFDPIFSELSHNNIIFYRDTARLGTKMLQISPLWNYY